MSFWLILLVTMLNHISFKASKVVLSLFSIELGASPLLIGVLFAMYSVFPVFWLGALLLGSGGWLMLDDSRRKESGKG